MSRVSQSQFDLPNSDVPKNDLTLPPPRLRPKEDFDEFAAPEALPESGREGLPPSYRMRADRHYIDRMSDSVGMPVRLVPVVQIEPIEDQTPPGDALTKSIASHGVLQPLLVAKRDDRYKMIAGRRRLAAAIAAGLTSVPCLVHDLSEAEAAVLAEAENVRGDRPESAAGGAVPSNIAEILREIASELVHLDRSAALLRRPSSGSVFQKTAVDLVAAQAWRTAWVANAVTLGLGEQRPARRARQLDSIVDRVAQGFEPELRLCGGQLQTNIAATAAIDAALGELALTGAILATLSQLEEFIEPSIEVRSTMSDKDFVVVEVLQAHAPVAPDVAQAFAGSAAPSKGHVVVALAGSVLRSVTAQYRGSTELITEGAGGALRCTFRV
jgi:ParB-like nuclease family protein